MVRARLGYNKSNVVAFLSQQLSSRPQHWSVSLHSWLARAEGFWKVKNVSLLCLWKSASLSLKSYSPKHDNVAHSVEKVKVISSFFLSSLVSVFDQWTWTTVGIITSFPIHWLFSISRERFGPWNIATAEETVKKTVQILNCPFFVYVCSRDF